MKTVAQHRIETRKLTVGYRGRQGLKPVFQNLSVGASSGELVALIGRNGIGKSTLLKTLAKLQYPLSGSVFVNGQDYQLFKRTAWSKILSIVTTNPIKAGLLSVYEFLQMGRYPYTGALSGFTNADYEIMDRVITLTGTADLLQKPLNEISDGERQRVMIARALIQDTPVIILDEPTAYLDLPNRHEIIHLLNRLAVTEQKLIIFSTHDLSIAIQEADTIWLMSDDECYQGSPEDLILNNRISQSFQDESLVFDDQTGSFRVHRQPLLTIGIRGSGNPLHWTIKALERIGIACTPDAFSEILLTVHEKNEERAWQLVNKSEISAFNSIYSLILHFKKYLLDKLI